MGISPGLLPFGEYAPDISSLNTQVSERILNVLPRADGYGPFPNLLAFTQSLPGICRGGFFARNADGSITVFGATDTRIYKLNNSTFAWVDVSKGGIAYSQLPSSDRWHFVQFNSKVLAVQVNTVPQVYDLTSSTTFDDLAGSPPQASLIAIINRFVVLGGLLGLPYRVQWSGLNAITTWDNVTSQSNFQDLADGGRVTGLAGGDQFGVIFQDSAIRSQIFAPGSPVTFEILRIATNDGLIAADGAVSAGDKIFFASPQGFKVISPGGYPEPIGREKVDRSFFDEFDFDNLQLLIAATDPTATRVYWAYKTVTGTTGQFDKMLVYDYVLARWTPVEISGQHLFSLAQPGITLENLDAISGSIDTMTTSWDSYPLAALVKLAAADTSNAIGFFNGANLEATLETPEQDGKGQRFFVSNVRPMTDCASAAGLIAARETAQAATTVTAEIAVNDIGLCPVDGGGIDTRYARVRMRMPAGADWTYAMGVEPEFRMTGWR